MRVAFARLSCEKAGDEAGRSLDAHCEVEGDEGDDSCNDGDDELDFAVCLHVVYFVRQS